MIAPDLLRQAERTSRIPGKAAEAWRMILPYVSADEISKTSAIQAAWILFRYLNKEYRNIDHPQLRRLLAQYLRFADDRFAAPALSSK